MGAGKLCLGHKLANFDTDADGGGVLLRRQNSLGTIGLLGYLAQWSLRRLPAFDLYGHEAIQTARIRAFWHWHSTPF